MCMTLPHADAGRPHEVLAEGQHLLTWQGVAGV